MGGGIIRTIILGIILVVLAFVLGSQAADGTKTPLLILGILCAFFVFNYLGPRCWWLLFILPPLLEQLPFGIIQKFPLHYGVAGLVLIYWVIMWAMGYVRFTWNGVLWMDVISLLPLIVMAVSFYNHPVSINALDLDVDAVGGEVFIWAGGAAVYYLALSCIPVTYNELARVYKIGFFITLVIGFIVLPQSFKMGLSEVGEKLESERFYAFWGIADLLLRLQLCAYPIVIVITSPWRFCSLVLCSAGIALCGFRGALVQTVSQVAFMAFVRKEILILLFLSLFGYGVLYYAGTERLLDGLPHGIQRSLAIIPGVEVGKKAETSASASNEWRYELWGLALDTQSGYIKDYVWGDGFGVSKRMLEREQTHAWRKSYVREGSKVSYYAENGVWHLSPIIWVHRLGFVGAAILFLWMVVSSFLLFRVVRVLLTLKGSLFLLVAISPFCAICVLELVGAGTPKLIFPFYTMLAVAKVVYSILQKEGSIPPLFSRRVYVPILIREQEEVNKNTHVLRELPSARKATV